MFRLSLAMLAGICLAGPLSAANALGGMFEAQSRDFGTVPRGPTLSHTFRFTNNTQSVVRVTNVRVSCGCVTAWADHPNTDIAPGQTSSIQATMDTRRFIGTKSVTIFVQFDKPVWEEVRLVVSAVGRDDVTLTPEKAAFGNVRRGHGGSVKVQIGLMGAGWQILEGQSESSYVQIVIREIQRTQTGVNYELDAMLRPETPVGKWYTDIWVKTNAPTSPHIRIPVTVDVESAVSINPQAVDLGEVKVGNTVEKNIVVRGGSPFKVTDIRGADGSIQVQPSSPESREVHIIRIKFKPTNAGNITRSVKIITDMKEEAEVELPIRATVVK